MEGELGIPDWVRLYCTISGFSIDGMLYSFVLYPWGGIQN